MKKKFTIVLKLDSDFFQRKHDRSESTVIRREVSKSMIIMIFQPCVDSQSCMINDCAILEATSFCSQALR